MSGEAIEASPALLAEPVSAPGVGGWRDHLIALGLVSATLVLLFARDAAAMADIWWNSSTYEHCLVVIPIVGWLVWQRTPIVSRVRPRGWALPLAWVAIGSFGWLIGEAAGVAAARGLGLAMMMQGTVAALLGRGITAALWFPIFYALFLVPIGDMVVPPLQTITARMCMALLHLAHVPARIDGVFITTPGGWFKVAEACSGAKFLIAMIALGVLVAHLGFLSWRRRAAFMALCVVVPILANGVRAFSTIWVAQYTGARAASGIDHVIYGWIFFAIVIATVMAASWRFFDRAADAPPVDAGAVVRQAAMQDRTMALAPAALAVLAIAAAGPAWAALVQARGAVPIATTAHLPDVPGWRRIPDAGGAVWRPRFDGADRLLLGRYSDASGAEVDLGIALYAWQGDGRVLVGFGHGAVDPDGPWAWAANLPAPADAMAERIEGAGQVSRIVISRYAVGAMITGSPARVKIETLKHHLIGGSQRAAAVLVSAEDDAGGAGGGRPAIDRFLAALGDTAPLIDRVAAGR